MPDRTHPNEHERSRPPTARRGSPLWLSVREPLARVDSVHLYFTHFTAWKRTPSSVTSASHRRLSPTVGQASQRPLWASHSAP